MTTLHAGGKFDNKAYRVSGGLHGVGVSVTNALSEWCEVKVSRDGKVHHQKYERGKAVSKVTVIGKARSTGTSVTFKPDHQIFSSATDLSFDTLSNQSPRSLPILIKESKFRFLRRKQKRSTRLNTPAASRNSSSI